MATLGWGGLMWGFIRVAGRTIVPRVTLVMVGWRGLEWNIPGVFGGVSTFWQALRGRPGRGRGLSWHRPTWKPFGSGLGFSWVIDRDRKVGFSKRDTTFNLMVHRISDEDLGLPGGFINTLSLLFVTEHFPHRLLGVVIP